jgi:hypothetical protein
MSVDGISRFDGGMSFIGTSSVRFLRWFGHVVHRANADVVSSRPVSSPCFHQNELFQLGDVELVACDEVLLVEVDREFQREFGVARVNLSPSSCCLQRTLHGIRQMTWSASESTPF